MSEGIPHFTQFARVITG